MNPIVLVCPSFARSRGVWDYTCRLGEELQRQGHSVELIGRMAHPELGFPYVAQRRWDARSAWRLAGAIAARRPKFVVLQYVPHLYARRGMTLSPVVLAWRLRQLGVPTGVMVHEAYVPLFERPRRLVVGVIQRLMLAGIVASVAWAAASTEQLAKRLSIWARLFHKSVNHLPVGSNIPVARDGEALELSHPALLLFGSLHKSKSIDWAIEAARTLGTRLLVIGADGHDIRQAVGGELSQWVDSLGYCSEATVSAYLKGADLLLQPFELGVSTRRTTVMAGLAHAKPVVTTVGPETDALLAQSGALCLSPAGDRPRFVERVQALAGDSAERARLAAAGRRLYERDFAWPRIAERLLAIASSGSPVGC